jgi:signal transduction histidine kinase
MKNGEERIGLGSAELIGIEGEPSGLSVARHVTDAVDLTERKLADESRSKVSQRLIAAQEEERVSIARELHHYIDSLILLSINLDRFRQNPPESVAEVRQEIGETRQQVKDIVSGILDLSHRLQIAKLEYLGLAKGAGAFCKELSDMQNLKIDFHSEGVPNELPKEIALCLYRVLQDALQNATAHRGSRHCEVSLSGKSNEILLTVREWGGGFDPAVAMKGPGLGLTIMKERLKLVDGNLSIESQPERGTTIHASVPLKIGVQTV